MLILRSLFTVTQKKLSGGYREYVSAGEFFVHPFPYFWNIFVVHSVFLNIRDMFYFCIL